MTKNGYNFDTSGIVADWTKMKRKRSGPVTVTFPTYRLQELSFTRTKISSGKAMIAHRLSSFNSRMRSLMLSYRNLK